MGKYSEVFIKSSCIVLIILLLLSPYHMEAKRFVNEWRDKGSVPTNLTITDKESKDSTEDSPSLASQKFLEELVDRRTIFSKQYRLKDGTALLHTTSEPLHYRSIGNDLLDIDTSIVPREDVWAIGEAASQEAEVLLEQNITSSKSSEREADLSVIPAYTAPQVPFYLELPSYIRDGYTVGMGEQRLNITPEGASTAYGVVDPQRSDRILYTDVWKDTDIILQVLPSGLKEDIVLRSAEAPLRFSFNIEGELTSELISGHLRIAPAYLIDHVGTIREVKQTLVEGAENRLDVTFDSTGLVYPITIDPTVEVYAYFEEADDRHEGYSAIYVNFPNLRASQLIEVEAFVEMYNIYDPDMEFMESEIYLTKQEYGEGLSHYKPGQDGRNVAYLGLTDLTGSGVFDTTDIAASVPGNTMIYGAAVYNDFMELSNDSYAGFNIIYNDTVDSEPPAAPANLVAASTGPQAITLTWTAATDNVGIDKYQIYNGSTLLSEVGGNVTSLELTDLPIVVLYEFTVVAVDAAWNYSPASNVATVQLGIIYKYDARGQLEEILYPNGDKFVFTYDANGNQLTRTKVNS